MGSLRRLAWLSLRRAAGIALLVLCWLRHQGQDADEMGARGAGAQRQLEMVAADPQSRTFTVRVKDSGELRMVQADEVMAAPGACDSGAVRPAWPTRPVPPAPTRAAVRAAEEACRSTAAPATTAAPRAAGGARRARDAGGAGAQPSCPQRRPPRPLRASARVRSGLQHQGRGQGGMPASAPAARCHVTSAAARAAPRADRLPGRAAAAHR